ncbi:ribokinase [Rhizobium tubonense]|uniref:Ribokinase n=1 Tax=Rhizobium tubonense TaxID=484088 RepID=A0A2W4CER3_9HYPH|nr:ribokinase [Rhizobium tubonense]PZM11552.1 ribokinase [Rhizobium tubonense]
MGRVIVLGNAGLDISLSVQRLPDLGETLLGHDVRRAPGGKGLNQAVTAARAGAEVLFRAPLGRDAQGSEIASVIAAEACLMFHPHHFAHPTDFSLLMVLPDGENSIVSAGPCAAAFRIEAAGAFAAKAESGDVFVMQGNLRADSTQQAMEIASRRGATTVFNPAPLWWDAKSLLPFCDIVVTNRGEAASITGMSDPTEGSSALCTLGAKVSIITLGADGCVVHQEGKTRHFAADPVEAVDTTGCGDTFCGVLAALLAQGQTLDDAIIRAQTAAAITATRRGAFAALPSRSELLA